MKKRGIISRMLGFSMVEMSVSLAIIAMIAASALSVAVSSDIQTKTDETNAKMRVIGEALTGFVALNQRLPCPANGELPVTDANFGLEGTRTPSATGADCPNANAIFTYNGGNSKTRGGIVPVRTLQLPDDYMLDGWGRRIVYVTDYDWVNNNITNTGCAANPATSSDCIGQQDPYTINLYVERGENSSYGNSHVAFVLISYGENGHGAYQKNGGSTRINAYSNASNPYRSNVADEIQNSKLNVDGTGASADNAFVARDYVRDDDLSKAAGTRMYFDDILYWVDINKLVWDSGAPALTPTCSVASRITLNPGNNGCTGAYNEDYCERAALELYKRCLVK